MAQTDEKRPLGLYCVFYDGETRPVAGFVLEQDARRYAEQHASGDVPWEVKHAHIVASDLLEEVIGEAVSEALERAALTITTGEFCRLADHMQDMCDCKELGDAILALKPTSVPAAGA